MDSAYAICTTGSDYCGSPYTRASKSCSLNVSCPGLICNSSQGPFRRARAGRFIAPRVARKRVPPQLLSTDMPDSSSTAISTPGRPKRGKAFWLVFLSLAVSLYQAAFELVRSSIARQLSSLTIARLSARWVSACRPSPRTLTPSTSCGWGRRMPSPRRVRCP